MRLIGALRDEQGAAALVIAAVIALLAFTALSIYLDKFVGGRTLARIQSMSSSQAYLTSAILAKFLQTSTPSALPCPDMHSPLTGSSSACNGASTTTGVLPWKDLGLSQDDVVDPYGDYYTYVVSHTAQSLCYSVNNDITGTAEATGSLAPATDLQIVASGQTRNVAFAIIGHGANRKGGINRNTGNANAAAADHELKNTVPTQGTTASPAQIYADNYSSTFDDVVFAPANADLEKICKSLTVGGQLNAQMSENFDSPAERSGTPDSTKFARSSTNVTVTADTRGGGNYVAQFTGGGDYLVSNPTYYNFDPTVRPVYISALWTPDPGISGMTDAGFSIATRATVGDYTSDDDFNSVGKNGVTLRFYCGTGDDGTNPCATANIGADISSGGKDNYLSVRNNGAVISGAYSSGHYSLIQGKTYILEAYDDGTNVWARITQRDNIANTAYVKYSFPSAVDRGGSQQVAFINHGAGTTYLDDVVIGLPMLALETDGTNSGYAATGSTALGFTAGAAQGKKITVEAWVRPRALTAATLVSDWETSGNTGYRFTMSSTGAVSFQISGDQVETAKGTGIVLSTNTWTHIAAVFDGGTTKTLTFYKNGVLSTVTSTTVSQVTDDLRYFSAGADYNGTAGSNGFNGDLSDIRVWETARTTQQIDDAMEQRQSLSVAVTGLILNWKLDFESGGVASTNTNASSTPSGQAGTLASGARYTASLANYFRPFSDATNFCPSGSRVGPYACAVYSTATSGTGDTNFIFPSNMYQVYVKAWGAGGGAFGTSAGGSGGFSGALITNLATAFPALTASVYAGGSGAASSGSQIGADGAGGSGIFDTEATPLGYVIAGGGGGASYSTLDVTGAGNCGGATILSSSQCGLGGNGGGSGQTNSEAPDQSSHCGGFDGDAFSSGNGPPQADCANPTGSGADPSGYLGGGTTAGGGGGHANASVLAGGTGFDGSGVNMTAVGGGGGGGGVKATFTTKGGGQAGGYDSASNGYGGGGGSGSVATSNVAYSTGAIGSYAAKSASFSDSSYTGNVHAGSNIIDGITNGSPGVNANWVVGMAISGTNIPANSIITAIDTVNYRITFAKSDGTVTRATTLANGTTLTVSSGAQTFSIPGGATDFHYSLVSPGIGGTSSITARGGAVLLLW